MAQGGLPAQATGLQFVVQRPQSGLLCQSCAISSSDRASAQDKSARQRMGRAVGQADGRGLRALRHGDPAVAGPDGYRSYSLPHQHVRNGRLDSLLPFAHDQKKRSKQDSPLYCDRNITIIDISYLYVYIPSGSGVSDLIYTPVKQWQKDGRVMTGNWPFQSSIVPL